MFTNHNLFSRVAYQHQILLIVVLVLLLTQPIFGQYYIAPQFVKQGELKSLKKQLANARTDSQKLDALISLSNLYFSKPLKNKSDLQTSLLFSGQAITLSKTIHNEAALNNALLLNAYSLLELRAFKLAENILPKLDEQGRLKLLLALNYFYRCSIETDPALKQKSLDCAVQALKLAKKLKNKPGELIALTGIAVAHGSLQRPGADKELLNILTLYKAAANPLLHYPYYYLASYYDDADEPDKAATYSLLALKSIKHTGDLTNAGDVYLLYAVVCYKNERYHDALDYGNRAISAYQKIPGSRNLSDPYLTLVISRCYQKLGEHQRALAYVFEMMRIYPAQNLADSMNYVSMIGHGYRELKQYERSEQYFKKFEQMSRKVPLQQNASDLNLSQLYVESRRYVKARPYLYRALDKEKGMSMGSKRHLRYMLFLTDSATGHFYNALRHMSFLNDESQSNRGIETDKALKKWEAVYETQKKEELLKLKNQNIDLLTQRSRAQQEKIERANQVRNLIAGGFLLVLVILCLLIYQYRQKQKSNILVLLKSNQINEKNVLLERLLNEKEWLLKEVHHRVKNNLHTIFCLLESQAVFLQDDALAAVETSRNRIYAMSLLHQKLYQSDNIRIVDMALYFNEFLVFLQRSFDLEERKISFEQVIEPIRFDIAVAIPLALILNEAVTNAIKYAFVNRESGVISISLKRINDDVELMISDNGVGLKKTEPAVYNSLGMELMRGLSLDIGAEINFEVNNGTTIKVAFMMTDSMSGSDIDRKLA